MKYMGSKRRIVGDILPIMLDGEHGTFVDVFCGGCNVIDHVPADYRRIANDVNQYLIAMWRHLVDGNYPELPTYIPNDYYKRAYFAYHGLNHDFTKAEIGWIGYMGSRNGHFFDGGYSGHHVIAQKGKERDYIAESIRNVLAQVRPLMGVEFRSRDYSQLEIPPHSIIYCDPPYKGTYRYKCVKPFNYNEFYEWCRAKAAEGHKVYVSEYSMPEDFECIWEKTITNSMHETKTTHPTEKLFTI